MVSGPTNLRCSGTIGNDRGGTAFGSKHRKNGYIGLELAYNRSSLTIAEDRGQPDISGVTFGVTLGPLFELPPCYAIDAKNQCESHISSFSFGFPGS
jgi:hypothetical protein